MSGMIRKFHTMTGVTVYTVDLLIVFIEINKTVMGRWRVKHVKWLNVKKIVSDKLDMVLDKIIKN